MRQTAVKLVAIGAALAATACARGGFGPDLFGRRTPASWALPVEVATADAFDAVVLPMSGPYAQHDTARARLRAYLEASGHRPSGPPFGRYFNDPAQVEEAALRWEVGYAVARPFEVSPPFELRRFPDTLVARMLLEGPYRSNARHWPSLHAWIAANGYFTLGPGMEFWSGDPAKGGSAGPRSELRIPVGALSVGLEVVRDVTSLFGGCLFALFLFLYLREGRARVSRWGGSAWGLIGLAWLCLYLEPLAWNVVYLYGDASPWLLRFARWSGFVKLVAAPLLVHLFYYKGRAALPHRRLWLAALCVAYAASAAWVAFAAARPATAEALSPAGRIENGAIAAAAALSLLIQHASRRDKGRVAGRGEHVAYSVVLAGIAASLTVQAVAPPGETVGVIANLVLFAAPIALLLVATYHNERAAFFDVLAKQGSFLLVALVLMAAYFGLVPSLLSTVRMGWVGLWLYPATLLPLFLAAPWTYRRLATLVDRHVLGRRYTPVEAGQHFFSALRGIAGEAEILRAAETEVADIFQAPARILEAPAPAVGGEASFLVAQLRGDGAAIGAIHVDASRGRRRLLSEDRALLASLAEGLSFLLDNARLQEKRRAQEVRARELALQASRSELRALRAQINPHFLFNALNTIAALIPRAPALAEQSVEQLAEVFRYALRGSESEWARVEEEMAFVGAYLDLERTRFAERLSVRLHVEDGAGNGLIPAMSVQTLVENAVKHGIGALRGRGRVEVDVRRCADRLRVEVRDTGPGFSLERALAAPTSPRGGRGLRNVRDRLHGYFGEGAAITCDAEADVTRVVLTLPFLTEPPEALAR